MIENIKGLLNDIKFLEQVVTCYQRVPWLYCLSSVCTTILKCSLTRTISNQNVFLLKTASVAIHSHLALLVPALVTVLVSSKTNAMFFFNLVNLIA